MKRLLAFFFCLIFLVSCAGEGEPKGLIDREKMVLVLTDVHLANAYTSTVMDLDTMKQITADYLHLVYKKHGIDSVRFKQSLKYYSEHPGILSEMYDQVLDRLEKKDKKVAPAEQVEVE
ncbi:MAG TPA: DUF4296 domain-containing protein [Sphingobacteriaceae bacterium]